MCIRECDSTPACAAYYGRIMVGGRGKEVVLSTQLTSIMVKVYREDRGWALGVCTPMPPILVRLGPSGCGRQMDGGMVRSGE